MNDVSHQTEQLGSADIDRVMQLLPHRYPFLLVDRIYDMRGDESCVGVKNVTANEPFFASVTRSVGRRIGVGDSLLDFAEDDSNAAQWREWYRRVLEGEGFQSSIRVTASTDMLETRFEPIFDASGEIVGGTVFAQDVTLRVQAERDLRASESRLPSRWTTCGKPRR